MNDFNEFDFINELPQRREPLTDADRAAYSRLGLLEVDISALERVLPYVRNDLKTRADALRMFGEALLHFRRHGARILEGLSSCLDEVFNRDHAKIVGGDSLTGKARLDRDGIAYSNDLRPFYVRILAAKRPDDARRITLRPSWADLLIVAQWPPITTGEDE